MDDVIRQNPADQPPPGRRSGRKAKRGWAGVQQPSWREPEPQPRPSSQRNPMPPHAPRRRDPLPPDEYDQPTHFDPPYETYGDRDPDRYGSPRDYPSPERDRYRDGRAYRDDRPYRDERDRRDYREFRDDRDFRDERDHRGHDSRRGETRHDPDVYREHPTERPAEHRPTEIDHYRDGEPATAVHYPKKLTVTRVAALRSKQLTAQAMSAFRKAANADGADKSGLTSLTYATMLNYAGDAAMAVALANTLFFSAASGESKGKVALYLLITVAPFALLAPVIGPMLDRLQRGRRLAMCAVSAGQALMCVIMALHFNDWMLYPAALGKMVLSKSFTVLKAAITPRVLPPEITLARTNARLTVFGLGAGAAGGAVAAGCAKIFDSPGALWFTVVICVVGAVQALRIPAWVEVTEGEVPASISARMPIPTTKRRPMGRHVVVSLWGNGTIRVLTGFLMMFAAFAVRAQNEAEPFQQLLLLGLIAGAAGVGSFAGNAVGARVHVGNHEQLVLGCVIAALATTVVATLIGGIFAATMVGLIGAVASALAKNSLDAVIQDDLPEESRASAFGRSETVLQLGWVFGGAVGVLLPPVWWVGFLVVSIMLAVGLVQTLLSRGGGSLIPGFAGQRTGGGPRMPMRPRGFRPRPAAGPPREET